MKKFFMSVALAAFTLLANAQVVIPVEGKGLFHKSGEKIVLNQAQAASPKKAASLDDTTLWGYYMGGFDEVAGVGVGSAATYYAGYFVPGDGVLKGSSISGVNLPIWTKTNMTNVSIWISEDLETNIVSQSVPTTDLKASSYNAIALDEPFAIPEDGIFIGVKFTISRVATNGDAYPVLCAGDAFTNSLVMKFTSTNGGQDWADYSNDFGSFAMQLFCSNLTLPERSAYFKSASSTSTLPGAEVSLPVAISSDGAEGVQSIDYVVEINGNKTTNHLDLPTPIAGGISKSGSATISFTAPEEYGAYTVNISIEKVNGDTNAASENVLAVTNKVVTKIATRKTVVEEFTGTGCGWCPRGWLGMEMLKETQENFIGIAFHKFNSSDPMYVANYYPTGSLGIDGAPGCSVDRKLLGIDPYYGSANSIVDDFDACNAILPDVDVTVSGKFNEDYTSVDITADIEYLIDGGKYTVVYVLTADSLSGTTAAWKQQNYYYSNYPSGTGDPMIDQFCRGGKYGSSSVALTFNDVMIGSSYNNAGSNLAPALEGEVKAGATATGTYTVNMPTKAALKEAINTNEVYAIALVIASDGTIANAARAKVTNGDDATSVEKAIADVNAKEIARYNAAGQVISETQKGLNIIKLSNGKTVKVIVK